MCVENLNLWKENIVGSYVGFSFVMSTLTLFRAFLAPVGAGAATGAGLVCAGLACGLAM